MEREWRGLQPWQWKAVQNSLPKKKIPFLRRRRKGGRPRADDRKCFEAILWSARTGLPWRLLPEGLGSARTASRRLVEWNRKDQLRGPWRRYLLQTSQLERDSWRRNLAVACARKPVFWRLELLVILDLEWPEEKRYT
jgi:transposase